MRFNCCFCKLIVSDRAKAIHCDHCNKWIHISCNELHDIDYKNLKNQNWYIWYCKLCTKEILPFCSKQVNTDENNSGHSKINTNPLNLLSQVNKFTENDNSEDENLPNCKYWDTSYFPNHITKSIKSKAFASFHLNVGWLPTQFDNFKYLINCKLNLIL